MKTQVETALIAEKLEEIRRQNEQVIESKLESMRLSHPHIDIPQAPREDEGFWAAGYATLKPAGIWLDFHGNFTSAETGDFHIDGRLYGPFIGGESKAAFVCCVFNPLADHFFDTDLASAIDVSIASTEVTMTWNLAPVGYMAGPSIGSIGGGGGVLRAQKFSLS